jgi:hypothetical protein
MGRARAAIVRSAPFFAVVFLYLGLRVVVLGPVWFLGFVHMKTTASMATGTLVLKHTPIDHPLVQTLLTIPGVLLEYLKLLALPWLVGPAHDVNFVTTATSSAFYLPAAILVLFAVASYLFCRHSQHANLYLFCVIWWLLTLAPVLNLDQIVALVGDRYEYLPSFGICLLVADLATQAARSSRARTWVLSGAGVALATVWVVILWRVQPVWHDNLAMFSRCVEMFPDSARYREGLGSVLVKQEDFTGAATQFAYASKLAPDDAGIHLTLGMMYLKIHRNAEAKREMEAYYHIVFNQKKQTAKPHWYVEFK